MTYNIYDDGIAEILPNGTQGSHNANIISSGNVKTLVNEYKNMKFSCSNEADSQVLEAYFN